MGATSALKCWQVLENAETVLAIELLTAGQALDYRLPTRPGVGPRIALETLRGAIPHAEADRQFGADMQTALQIVRSQSILEAVQQKLGALD